MSFSWRQLGLDISGKANDDKSGWEVSLSADGSIVAIGAPGMDDSWSQRGHVRIYKYLNNTWTQLGADIDGVNNDDYSGSSVSLSADGTIVAIGTMSSRERNSYIKIYKYLNNAWSQLGTDIDGKAFGVLSSYKVALSSDGSTVAIGAPNNNNNKGITCVYKYLNNAWTQLGTNIDGEFDGDLSGISVSLSSDGTIVAIGAPNHNTGTVSVYKYLNNVWSKLGGTINGKALNNKFGAAVSLSANGSIVAIGASSNDLYNSGLPSYISIYEYLNNAWTKLGTDIDAKYFRNSVFNSFISLSADGKKVAIGDPCIYGNVPGSVSVYEYSDGIIRSPTCFPAGTLVLTDQGEISIENIDCNTNTIRGKKIVAITKTVTIEDKIVCIEKDALSQNVPSRKMCISRNHKLLFNKEMIEAKNLIGEVEGIYYKKYNGEILYNVLMETHNKMRINNVVVETLDPNNIVAKLHDGSLNSKEINTIIVNINQYANYCKKEYSKLH